ncbi:hypothetical protein MJO28_011039, partial [Puccinia striiformis f. sp. tritici]
SSVKNPGRKGPGNVKTGYVKNLAAVPNFAPGAKIPVSIDVQIPHVSFSSSRGKLTEMPSRSCSSIQLFIGRSSSAFTSGYEKREDFPIRWERYSIAGHGHSSHSHSKRVFRAWKMRHIGESRLPADVPISICFRSSQLVTDVSYLFLEKVFVDSQPRRKLRYLFFDNHR